MDSKAYELQSEFALRYAAKGKAEGEARALLRVLARRGLEPSEEIRSRIESCRDQEQLDIWLDRAVTAETVHEVFD
jgi:hypothetical protein